MYTASASSQLPAESGGVGSFRNLLAWAVREGRRNGRKTSVGWFFPPLLSQHLTLFPPSAEFPLTADTARPCTLLSSWSEQLSR